MVSGSRYGRLATTRERVADASDNAVPTALFSGWIVDQHTIDEATGKIASVVPNLVALITGDHKEPSGDPAIDDICWGMLLHQEDRWRISCRFPD